MEYQTVIVKGYFLHDREVLMGPRSLITDGNIGEGGGLITQQQESVGYHVITPLKLEDREYVNIFFCHNISKFHRIHFFRKYFNDLTFLFHILFKAFQVKNHEITQSYSQKNLMT